MNPLPAEAVLAPGSVALIGGGPGALDLVTVRGLALLRQADVVVVDRLGPVGLTEQLGEDVEVIDVGKTPGRPSLGQAGIEELLVAKALAGHRVARLKGGDPFVLGRGGEEVLACRAAGVPVQVVPGVTSAIAGPAAGDVPVTHRGRAVAVHIVNAHGDLGPADLAALADPGTTTVLMMGVGWLPRLAAQALLNGVDPATPVAIVQSATLPAQRTVHGTLATITEVAREHSIAYPAVIAVGPTAAEGFLEPPRTGDEPRGSGREALNSSPALTGPAAEGTAPASFWPVLIGCAHGTRIREGRDVIRALLQDIAGQLPGVAVREAYVDVQSPELAEVVARHAPVTAVERTRETEGAPAAVVVPLLLSTGFHVGQDVAEAVTGREALAAEPLGPDPRLAEVMAQRLAEAGAREDDIVVMAVAGTRDEAGQAMARRMSEQLGAHLGRSVGLGYISAAQPPIAEAVAAARAGAAAGARVVIANYLLAPGTFHAQLETAGADLVAAPLGNHPLVAQIAADRFRTALGA
ncbi:uroporphyrinogen-III C-methyltransferase [Brachybacterium sp. YJGR34]|uniref:uroporphyrinogen-III C-methyltransferase n=1 Tax=Brachybacterium sp. YJGR34 TaxID=2059911 RepID=UPI000E0BA339|nr:uroporphyrinogen-III C-methyltransferase [Brachybacterium sp. YJGR34]